MGSVHQPALRTWVDLTPQPMNFNIININFGEVLDLLAPDDGGVVFGPEYEKASRKERIAMLEARIAKVEQERRQIIAILAVLERFRQ